MSVKRSNFTLIFFTAVCHDNPVAAKKEQAKIYIFQDTCFEISQIHQIIIMYRFEYTNHSILLNCLFKYLHKFFFHACNLDH